MATPRLRPRLLPPLPPPPSPPRNPPLLGFFDKLEGFSFIPTLEAPNRVPPRCFSLPSCIGDSFQCLGCRHGLVLIFLCKHFQLMVWNPATGEHHRLAIPLGVATYAKNTVISGAVLRDAGDVHHFQVVLAVVDGKDEQHVQAHAYVFSSQITGLWGNLISTSIPYEACVGSLSTRIGTYNTLLAGEPLYFVLAGCLFGILEFDLVKQSLAMIEVPKDMCGEGKCFKMMRAEGGGLGFLLVSDSDCTAQLWTRKTDCDDVASWGIARTIHLDKLLSLKSEEEEALYVVGFAEENNVVFLWTMIGLFMIHLESLKFKKLLETIDGTFPRYHPFESVYTAGI